MSTILIVEDEPKLAQLLQDYLTAAGFQALWVNNGNEALPAYQQHQPDLVLLDLMLPGRDGLDICRELRQLGHVPIIMLTARVEEIDRLLGLELGADDYICKPFSPREVIARVKALLRRTQSYAQAAQRPPEENTPAGTEEPGAALHIDSDRYLATLDGQPLSLTPVEFRMLRTLASAPGIIFSRDQLLSQLYNDHRVVADRTVDSHIKNLRRKLQAIRPEDDIIRSIYGVGYRLELD